MTVMDWWERHDGEGWDPERAARPGHGGQPSDFTLFYPLLALDDRDLLAAVRDRSHSDLAALEASGALVEVKARQVEAKEWDEDQHPRDDHGRFSDGGDGGGHVIEATNPSGGYHADDLKPYIGKEVTVREVTASGSVRTTTGTLTAAESVKPGNSHFVGFAPGARFRAEESTGVREAVLQHGTNATRINATGMSEGSTFTITAAEKAPDSRPDDRTYTGKYPEVDAAIKDARAILLRQGPPTPDEITARAGFYCATGDYLQREMNSGLYAAWQMGQAGKSAQEWAVNGFRNWYNSESRSRPMMAAYGGASYADRLANVIAKAKDSAVGNEDKLRWPAAKDGNQQTSLQMAQGMLATGFRLRDTLPLANKVAGYLTEAGKAIAAGAKPAPPDPALIHELRQSGYRAQSLSTYKADPNSGPTEQLGEAQIASMVKEGVNVPAMLPTGRAILAEQAVRKVGASIDAAVDAKTAGLSDREARTRTAMQTTRIALASREGNVRVAHAAAERILDETVHWGAWKPSTDPDENRLRMALSQMTGDQADQLKARLPEVADRGADAVRQMVEVIVPPGAVRDAVLARVDGQAKKLDSYARQIGKANEVLGEHGLDSVQSDPLIKERRDATVEVLAGIRPMGQYSDWRHGVLPGGAKISGATSGQMLAAVAATRFPQEWLEKAAQGPKVDLRDTTGRASWDDTNNVLTWRGGEPPIKGDPPGGDVMIHEMAHMMESRVPGVTELEHAHWWQRTANEPTVSLRDVSGRGYDEREVCRPDKFFDPYAGKSYGTSPESHFELLSTGTQAATGGAFGGLRGVGVNRLATDDPITRRPPLNSADDDLRHFTLGILATV